jgi:hypothetical protein
MLSLHHENQPERCPQVSVRRIFCYSRRKLVFFLAWHERSSSFFGFSAMTPEFLFYRGFIHFALFLICFISGSSENDLAKERHEPSVQTTGRDLSLRSVLANFMTG